MPERTDEAVIEAPAGKSTIYEREGTAWCDSYLGLDVVTYSDMAGEMIEGDDGYVYIKNPLIIYSQELGANSYVKGERQGDKIVVKLPQLIKYEYDEEWGEYDMYMSRLHDVDNGDGTWSFVSVDEPDNMIVYELDGDEWVMQDTEEYEIVGVIDQEGWWYGYGDFNDVFRPYDKTVLDIPEGLEVQKWGMACDNTSTF